MRRMSSSGSWNEHAMSLTHSLLFAEMEMICSARFCIAGILWARSSLKSIGKCPISKISIP